MEVCRYLTRCLTFRTTSPQLYRPLATSVSPLSFRKSFTSQSLDSGQPIIDKSSELFEYTSGRWIYNDSPRHSQRKRFFNISELKCLAAASVNQRKEDVTGFKKLADGIFNRTFLITMRDGFQLVARIPYPLIQPKHLVVASEVATMDFLRLQGIPVPKVYGYSAVADNAAGSEYIFMEFVGGRNLGYIWDDMPGKDRRTVITKLVELESRLFALRFPASGSLYYTKDLQPEIDKVIFPTMSDGYFCIGPDTRRALWYGKRLDLQVDRGPYIDATAALTAGAKKEIAYLTNFGQPRHPFQRHYRGIYDYQKQSHLEHMESLEKYLQIAPHLIPTDNSALASPTIRHPNFQQHNIFVSDSLEITGLIDWQHCTVLPLLLQCGVPNNFQSYSDDNVLEMPQYPFEITDILSARDIKRHFKLYYRRQLHYWYAMATAKLNPTHHDALTYDLSTLRRKLINQASYPWMGDNVALKVYLAQLVNNWSWIAHSVSSTTGDARLTCPIAYSEDEVSDCMRLNSEQVRADEQLDAYGEIVGVHGLDGSVSLDEDDRDEPKKYIDTKYDEAKEQEKKLRASVLDSADSDERRKVLCENWIFDDFDEEEYL